MATAATRTVDLEIMIDMFGGCVCGRVLRGVCVYLCVYLDVYERIRKFSECQTGSELLSFRARTPIEDAYRGRPLVSRVLFPPFALGWDPDRSRRDLSSRTDVGEEARRREGDRGPGRSVACGDREDGRGDWWARGKRFITLDSINDDLMC